MNPLKSLTQLGQSVWLDMIRRDLITSGTLEKLVREDGLRGLTSNPAIFEKAIAGSPDYAKIIEGLLRERDRDAKSLFEALAVKDIQDAADVLRPVYDESKARDGYVSLEVSPYLAHDTEATIEEGRRLWGMVGRPNLLIKVPGTLAGVPAIRRLISEGINVNVTLLFSQEAYERVAIAYIEGLEDRAARGGDLRAMASVASFFVSRIDSLVDSMIDAKLKKGAGAADTERLKGLLGKVAIANARQAYQFYKTLCAGARWKKLAERGAQTQRLLWASTSTKNPAYRDVVYAEELIGPDTVDTMPPATVDAFRDHGRARASLEEGVEAAGAVMKSLADAGISMKEVTDQLLDDAVRLFADPFDALLLAVERKRQEVLGAALDRQSHKLPEPLAAAVAAEIEAWRAGGKVRRLWARDATLWTGKDESRWLDWLGAVEAGQAAAGELGRFAAEAKTERLTHALLLGMGGSSLGPEVLASTFGRASGFPELRVLDSTDPAQVRTCESAVSPKTTLFIVSSKSGSTLEPNIFKQYFFEKTRQAVGAGEAGRRFVAITDPGSKVQEIARADGFRKVFAGVAGIGGRYSVLSNFGLAPAAVAGIDVARLLERATAMVNSCSAFAPPAANPGVTLGIVLGVLARHGRDKVTIASSPGIGAFGAWLEQLLAESTGKQGKGLVPVDLESLGRPDVYGDDRLFVYVRLETAPDRAQDAAIEALEKAGQPVVTIRVTDAYALGQEFFRWEIATAVAGAVLGINPFDQPDVEASKNATRDLTTAYEKTGALPKETPFHEEGGIALFADAANAKALQGAAAGDRSLAGYLRAHLGRLGKGDYCAFLAYIEKNAPHEEALQAMRHAVRDRRRVATCLGFGPRFLHSTGQAYKGGPNTGVFTQITCDDPADLPVPGQSFTFGIVKAAQARGDFQVLADRGRRALRIHLGRDLEAGLAALRRAFDKASA
jgi:transaldolase/glucose-6-phosphate isomerase